MPEPVHHEAGEPGTETRTATATSRATRETTFAGGNGNDTIYGGSDQYWVNCQNGNDVRVGGDGNDFVIGEAGTDQLTAAPVATCATGTIRRELRMTRSRTS